MNKIILSDEEFDAILEELEKPAAPNEKLLEAARRHKERFPEACRFCQPGPPCDNSYCPTNGDIDDVDTSDAENSSDSSDSGGSRD